MFRRAKLGKDMPHHRELCRWPGIAALACVASLIVADPALADDAADELARQATDPTAPLMTMNFIGEYTGDFHGPSTGEDDAFDLSFRPAIPFTAFGKSNIMRLTIPYRLNGPGDDGLGQVAIFDIVVTKASWGRWILGGVATMSSSESTGDDFAIGPAFGAVVPISKKLTVGAFSQNVFAGDTALSQLQPIVAYQLGEGWSLSAGDLQFGYDWKADRWVSIPIGFQIGKVMALGSQPIRLALNPQYNLADDPGLFAWKVSLTFALLSPLK